MRWHEIISETPEHDLAVHARAMHIVETFKNWLEANAKETTLANAGGRVSLYGKGEMAWIINAAEIGLPASYRDLYLGFTWSTVPGKHKRADGALARSEGYGVGDGLSYYATLRFYGDPTGKTSNQFSPIWEHLFHEVIHYFDYRYGVQRDGRYNHKRTKRIADRGAETGTPEYYNDSLELNAYFQMGLSEIFNSILTRTRYRVRPDRGDSMEKVLVSFETFRKEFMWAFDQAWIEKLTPENRKKIMRRLFKVYQYIAASWPDTKELAAAIERLKAAERETAERWAREDAELAAQIAA